MARGMPAEAVEQRARSIKQIAEAALNFEEVVRPQLSAEARAFVENPTQAAETLHLSLGVTKLQAEALMQVAQRGVTIAGAYTSQLRRLREIDYVTHVDRFTDGSRAFLWALSDKAVTALNAAVSAS